MDIYLVGGAVRDECLGLKVKDRDWVVVGAKPEELTSQGYRSVGRDFPVFLHPGTHEEYALARTERKSGHGYRGFETYFDPSVTLEEDLHRRDLTINAMARDRHGQLIDPYGGYHDLKQGILRHVSDAFVEDPLRVLRVARFAARFAHLGFRVADETMALMQKMVAQGELNYLVAERVWQELQRSLDELRPSAFFITLRKAKALQVLLPEIDALFGVPQAAEHHPEIDTGEHVMLALDLAARENALNTVKFAVLLHDLGKALTPQTQWPRHIGHEERGVPAVLELCKRLRVPNDYRDLAVQCCRWHLHIHRAKELRPSTLMKVFNSCDALRRPERFQNMLLACEYDARGRLGRQDQHYPMRNYMIEAVAVIKQPNMGDLDIENMSGVDIGQQLYKLRINRLKKFRSDYIDSKS